MLALYSHGDSVVWGAELDNKKSERFSNYVANELGAIDCNNASSGISNDYIYRQTMRDVSHWLMNGVVWSEDNGWVNVSKLIVVIGWTAPTRFEWWDGSKYQQERLWVGYDKWGDTDKDRTTEDGFVLNQTEDIPSYIKTFNHIVGLSSFLEKSGIPYYFFNTFYGYEFPNEPKTLIDNYGKPNFQLDLYSLWNQLPQSFRSETMYNYTFSKGHYDLLPRKHPTKEAHNEWADFLIKELEYEKR
jgi:hypothetical protein